MVYSARLDTSKENLGILAVNYNDFRFCPEAFERKLPMLNMGS
jgi:hypothetical protein